MKIIILGKMCSGKSTQAKLISKRFRLPYVSTGEIFRDIAKKNSNIGRLVKDTMEKGMLLPNNIVFKIVDGYLKKNFVVDGYPRNIEQARHIGKIDAVIYVNISDKEAIERASTRLQCPKCRAIYSGKDRNNIPNICRCGSPLFKRADDAAIKKRLKIYHKETEPILKFYKKNGLLKEIDGEQDAKKVFANICKALHIDP